MLDFGGKLYSMNTCRHIYLKFCARKRVDRNSSTRFCDTEKVGRCGGFTRNPLIAPMIIATLCKRVGESERERFLSRIVIRNGREGHCVCVAV